MPGHRGATCIELVVSFPTVDPVGFVVLARKVWQVPVRLDPWHSRPDTLAPTLTGRGGVVGERAE